VKRHAADMVDKFSKVKMEDVTKLAFGAPSILGGWRENLNAEMAKARE
jgi:hypothetical protein